ncbi:hypothetical protein TTHERM_001169451 (macronuclear) [Tetrahymena thermophila SB210]|uniref:Uncharacterized protein n=1 Tax=Tetrahymena thermophila (strain SB210) TaxID=312017 RepID=W7XJI1_TETTS|nr:hypothetical protein TTHERM_001169451 [Tetrahymena thermophila SB210]EWS74179.1 hypothetical protein TTHERM_001169451 [Tetrahymena thermophila SB210]|eukprot:XP_012653286.1 hypothetical protein TTHERM_001169451 [Tetrahymena thermophila SB210]
MELIRHLPQLRVNINTSCKICEPLLEDLQCIHHCQFIIALLPFQDFFNCVQRRRAFISLLFNLLYQLRQLLIELPLALLEIMTPFEKKKNSRHCFYFNNLRIIISKRYQAILYTIPNSFNQKKKKIRKNKHRYYHIQRQIFLYIHYKKLFINQKMKKNSNIKSKQLEIMKTSDFIKGLVIKYMDSSNYSRITSEKISQIITKYQRPNQKVDERYQSQFNVSHATYLKIYEQFKPSLSYQYRRTQNGGLNQSNVMLKYKNLNYIQLFQQIQLLKIYLNSRYQLYNINLYQFLFIQNYFSFFSFQLH